MTTRNKYKEFCVGCGLCKSEFGCEKYYENGFPYFDNYGVDKEFYENVCPLSKNTQKYIDENPWGEYKNIYCGWSKDENIRFKASSGGILTSLAIYLLEKKYVDEIIQIKADPDNPLQTIVVCSSNKNDVIDCMGSRYCNSCIFENLNNIVNETKKYALIGRPCDILTLKNYQKTYNKYKNIIYTMAFFCAGNPSDIANEKLLTAIGIKDIKECQALKYRGDGWPGFTKAKDSNGKEYRMKYSDSWGKYLGRDIRLMCKFCLDGCGAAADIACGDYWILNNERKPLFDEGEGRNLIFARSDNGNKILLDALEDKYIELYKFNGNNDEKIEEIQPAQFERTTTIFDKMIAFKIFFRNTPNYSLKKLMTLAKYNCFKNRIRIFKGTIKRIIKGRM